jgi:hypothetical protein
VGIPSKIPSLSLGGVVVVVVLIHSNFVGSAIWVKLLVSG